MNRRGFTMLEVLITSAVMVLLVLVAYPTLNAATQRQEQVANMTILEICVTQGIASAKAPMLNTTSTVHIKFSTASLDCQIAEADGEDVQTVTATYNIAHPELYTLELIPDLVPGEDIKEYVISVRPPYHFVIPDPVSWQQMTIGLRSIENPAAYNSTVFNLITGTIQSRSL